MAGTADDDLAFVIRHPRFLGVAPKRVQPTSGGPTVYVVRIRDDGREIAITGTLPVAFALAADALRKTGGAT